MSSGPEDSQISFHERVRKLRETRGLSITEMAVRLGVSRGYLSAIEGGHRAPSASLLDAIALRLGANDAWLRRGEPPMLTSVEMPAQRDPAELSEEERMRNVAHASLHRIVGMYGTKEQAEAIVARLALLDPGESPLDKAHAMLTRVLRRMDPLAVKSLAEFLLQEAESASDLHFRRHRESAPERGGHDEDE